MLKAKKILTNNTILKLNYPNKIRIFSCFNVNFILLVIIFSLYFIGCKDCPDDLGTGVVNYTSEIYFSATTVNDTVPKIYGISADGSNFRIIANNGELYSQPSGDNKLVFLQKDYSNSSNNKIFLMELSNGKLTQINPPSSLGYSFINLPIISPDGLKLVFCGSSISLYYFYLDMTQSSMLIGDYCDSTIPAFSNDSKKIAFYNGDFLSVQSNIKIFDLIGDTTYALNVYNYGVADHYGYTTIDWSKDTNNYLTYIISSNGFLDILYNISIDRRDTMMWNTNAQGAFNPTISHDRTSIAFVSKDGNIYIQKINEKNPIFQKLTNCVSGESILYPQWSKDDKYILYTKYYDGNYEKYKGSLEVINVSTGEKTLLCNNAFRGFWSR